MSRRVNSKKNRVVIKNIGNPALTEVSAEYTGQQYDFTEDEERIIEEFRKKNRGKYVDNPIFALIAWERVKRKYLILKYGTMLYSQYAASSMLPGIRMAPIAVPISIVRTKDNYIVMGRMNAGTLSAGIIQFVGGALDRNDLDENGHVSLDNNVRRETMEELGVRENQIKSSRQRLLVRLPNGNFIIAYETELTLSKDELIRQYEEEMNRRAIERSKIEKKRSRIENGLSQIDERLVETERELIRVAEELFNKKYRSRRKKKQSTVGKRQPKTRKNQSGERTKLDRAQIIMERKQERLERELKRLEKKLSELKENRSKLEIPDDLKQEFSELIIIPMDQKGLAYFKQIPGKKRIYALPVLEEVINQFIRDQEKSSRKQNAQHILVKAVRKSRPRKYKASNSKRKRVKRKPSGRVR